MTRKIQRQEGQVNHEHRLRMEVYRRAYRRRILRDRIMRATYYALCLAGFAAGLTLLFA